MTTLGLSGLLGAGATWDGDLVFDGRVRIDGIFRGKVTGPDLLEIGPSGSVTGEIEVAQALVAGLVDGTLVARERCTLLETAIVRGRIVTPWLDCRVGSQLDATVVAMRDGGKK